MMEDWTNIIGEELESIEEPLPADDWNVFQQKYVASRKRKKTPFFAWAGGITSVAAAIALVLMLARPETVLSDDDLVADQLSPAQEIVPADTVSADVPSVSPETMAPVKKIPLPAAVNVKDDVLMALDETEEVFDEVKDTAPTEPFFADAGTDDDTYEVCEDEPKQRKRRPVSVGLSGTVSGSLLNEGTSGSLKDGVGASDLLYSEALPPKDSLDNGTPGSAMGVMRSRRSYSESYDHELPVSLGLSVRFSLTDRLSVSTGINYTKYTSTRTISDGNTIDVRKDRQHVHYVGMPVRMDWTAVDLQCFNLYFGAGMQMDKCVHATLGEEILHEKQILFGLNAAMGAQVNIVPMVGLYFEPEVSYAINEGTIETFRSNAPFVVTIRAGLRFNF